MDDIQNILNAMIRAAVSPQTAAVAIAVIGLNIHFGYTGLLNIGQSAFMLLGAYGFAIAITQGMPAGRRGHRRAAARLRVRARARRPDAEAARRLPGDRDDLGGGDRQIRRQIRRLREAFDLTGGAQGIPGSQYRGPFTDLSPFGSGNTTILEFNYTDVADGCRLGPARRLAGRDRPDRRRVSRSPAEAWDSTGPAKGLAAASGSASRRSW